MLKKTFSLLFFFTLFFLTGCLFKNEKHSCCSKNKVCEKKNDKTLEEKKINDEDIVYLEEKELEDSLNK